MSSRLSSSKRVSSGRGKVVAVLTTIRLNRTGIKIRITRG